MYIYTYLYIYVCMYTCVYICINEYIHMYMHTGKAAANCDSFICTCIYVIYMYVCIYIFMNICICVCIQVTKFNKALKETAYGSGEPRLIDGILLTKFDTIDDKVCCRVLQSVAECCRVL